MKMLKVILCYLFVLPLSAMELASAQKKYEERFEGKKIELQPGYFADQTLRYSRKLSVRCNLENKTFSFEDRRETFLGWQTTSYPITIESVFSHEHEQTKLIGLRSLGLYNWKKGVYLAAVIATFWAKDGEHLREKEACFLGKHVDEESECSKIVLAVDGKISRIKFKLSPDEDQIRVVSYSHRGDVQTKMAGILSYVHGNPLMYSKKPSIVKRWKEIKE